MAEYKHLLNPRVQNVTRDAGFFRRAVAFIIDILVLDFIVTAPFTPLFAKLMTRVETAGFFRITYSTSELAAMIVLFLLVYLYFVVFEYVLGQTIGQMILGINVKSNEKLWQHLVRNLFLIPVFPLILFWIIEPLTIIASKRSVLERLSKTRTLYQQKVIL